MRENIRWFVGGTMVMVVLGVGIAWWYKDATEPIIVPYVSPTPTVFSRTSTSSESVSGSVTPSLSQTENILTNPQTNVNPFLQSQISDTPSQSPDVSISLSETSSPTVFPRSKKILI